MSIIESTQSLILEDRTDYGCAGIGMFNMCPSYKLYVKNRENADVAVVCRQEGKFVYQKLIQNSDVYDTEEFKKLLDLAVKFIKDREWDDRERAFFMD